MARPHRIAFAAILACALACPAFAQQDDAAIATATAVLDRLDAGQFEAATEDFNAQMKAALDADQLAAVQRQLDSAGAVQSRGEAQVSRRDGFTVVAVRIQRALAAIDATVAIDGDGKVAGLYFVPAAGGDAQ